MKKLLRLLSLAGFLVVLLQGTASAESCATDSCHRSILDLEKPHAPVKEKDCLSCHRQTNKLHPLTGQKSFELTSRPPALCTQCHDITPFKQKYMHGPVAAGACTTCHNPHESAEKNLLTDTPQNLCLKCHPDFAKALKEARVIHPPLKNGPCSSCHNPHGSPIVGLLKKKMPELCVGCHVKTGKKLAGVKVPHKPFLQEGGCSSCHSAHYSEEKGLLHSDEISTCLRCHDKDNLGTPPLRNIKKELAGKKYLHGPLAAGECKACHDPHGSDDYRMLRGSYPATLYAPYKEGIYGACLNCHEKNLLRFPDTTIYTGFRNGNRNLHYVHVVNNRKGRTCRICHDTHASTGPKMISSEGTTFGDWKIPINFKISPSGGSCAPGCHKAFTYDREKPEAY
jgi:predicted CXXCH cytochrome family protein